MDLAGDYFKTAERQTNSRHARFRARVDSYIDATAPPNMVLASTLHEDLGIGYGMASSKLGIDAARLA